MKTMKLNDITKDYILENGGNEWEAGKHHRIYLGFDLALKVIGLEYRKTTHNITESFLNGEKISNNKAFSIVQSVDKSYYDVNEDCLVGGVVNYLKK